MVGAADRLAGDRREPGAPQGCELRLHPFGVGRELVGDVVHEDQDVQPIDRPQTRTAGSHAEDDLVAPMATVSPPARRPVGSKTRCRATIVRVPSTCWKEVTARHWQDGICVGATPRCSPCFRRLK